MSLCEAVRGEVMWGEVRDSARTYSAAIFVVPAAAVVVVRVSPLVRLRVRDRVRSNGYEEDQVHGSLLKVSVSVQG